ncbi:hypothetical protein MKX08_004255 [Trichoderma sp. CBMAI-0020]|nr:hypothetical protein MKX08_004255 [Trichoderma sp. CBMAI-0020]
MGGGQLPRCSAPVTPVQHAAALPGCHLRRLTWCPDDLFPTKKSVCSLGITAFWTASPLLAHTIDLPAEKPRAVPQSSIFLVAARPGQGPTSTGLWLIWRDSNRDRGGHFTEYMQKLRLGMQLDSGPEK